MGNVDVQFGRRGNAEAPARGALAGRPAAMADLVELRCDNCGCMMGAGGKAIKRGAVVVLHDPLRVLWRRRYVPLSPTEVVVFAAIAKRGRATFDQVDEAMRSIGMKPENRSVIIFRIREKFKAMGAINPLVRKSHGITLTVEPDESNSTEVVIGLPQSEFDTIY